MFSEEHPLSPRFVLAHINHLSYDSAFVAELRGGQQFRGWDEDRYQQAAVINSVRALSHMFVLANSDPKKSKPKPPEPWPIPDEKSKKKQPPGSFAFIANAHLAAAKKRKEGGS